MRALLSPDLARHAKEFLRALANFKYERTESGLYFPGAKVMAHGEYIHDVNGEDERRDRNLVVDQGLTDMLNCYLGDGTAPANWYVALFAGATAPAANWTAANFAATASEITSGSEGYSEATRQAFTASAAASNIIDNIASKAAFTIITASQLNVKGAAVLSNNVKGSTAGLLVSATAFASTRVLSDDDIFNVGYRVTLASS
jgi:hypothetical protein